MHPRNGRAASAPARRSRRRPSRCSRAGRGSLKAPGMRSEKRGKKSALPAAMVCLAIAWTSASMFLERWLTSRIRNAMRSSRLRRSEMSRTTMTALRGFKAGAIRCPANSICCCAAIHRVRPSDMRIRPSTAKRPSLPGRQRRLQRGLHAVPVLRMHPVSQAGSRQPDMRLEVEKRSGGFIQHQRVCGIIHGTEAKPGEVLAELQAAPFLGQRRLGLLALRDVRSRRRPRAGALHPASSNCRLPREAIQRTVPSGIMMR